MNFTPYQGKALVQLVMGNLSIDKQKEWAEELFMRGGITQKAIAAKVGCSEQAIVEWKQKYEWEEMRTVLLTGKKQELGSLYRQLKLVNEMNEIAMTDDDDNTNPNFDAISKLTKSIKSLEIKTGAGEMMDAARALVLFVQKEDWEAAQIITKWSDLFINDLMQQTKM